MAVLTVQFKVGVPRTEALVRLYDVLNANQDWLPRGLGTLPPIVRPKGIDDVPVLAVTLWSRDAHQRQRTRARRARDGSRAQARARHARGADHRRPRPRRAGDAAARAAARTRRRPAAPEADAGRRQPGDACRHRDRRRRRRRPHARWRWRRANSCARPTTSENLVVGVHEGKPVYLREVAQRRGRRRAAGALRLVHAGCGHRRQRRQGRRSRAPAPAIPPSR